MNISRRRFLRGTGVALGVASLGVCSGCGTLATTSDITLVNLKTGEQQQAPYAGRRQMVISVDRGKGQFTTIKPENGETVLQTYDRSPKVVSVKRMSNFEDGLGSHWTYALSPDGKEIAHAHVRIEGSRTQYSLNMIDVASGKSRLLQDDLCDTQDMLLSWLDVKTLLFCRQRGHSSGSPADVSLIDAASGKRRSIYHPETLDSYSDATLSPDRNMLAFADATIHGFGEWITIIKLPGGELVKQIRSSNAGQLHETSWSWDGSELAFVDGSTLKIWNRASDAIREIATAPKGLICYATVFGRDLVGMRVGDADGGASVLMVYDATTGVTQRQVKHYYNGRLIPLDGETVICETGY